MLLQINDRQAAIMRRCLNMKHGMFNWLETELYEIHLYAVCSDYVNSFWVKQNEFSCKDDTGSASAITRCG